MLEGTPHSTPLQEKKPKGLYVYLVQRFIHKCITIWGKILKAINFKIWRKHEDLLLVNSIPVNIYYEYHRSHAYGCQFLPPFYNTSRIPAE